MLKVKLVGFAHILNQISICIPGCGDLECAVPEFRPGCVLEGDVELEVGEVVAVLVQERQEPALEGQL